MMIQLYFNVFHNIFLVFNSVAHGTIGTYRLGSRQKKPITPSPQIDRTMSDFYMLLFVFLRVIFRFFFVFQLLFPSIN